MPVIGKTGAAADSGSRQTLIYGDDLGMGAFNNNVQSLDLVQSDIVINGTTLTAGNILVSLEKNDNDVSGVQITKDDVFVLNLTQAGQIVGTSHYISPEQAVGGDMDGRSDLYALGVIMYEMLEGKRPYTGKSPVEIMQQHVEGPVPSLNGVDDPLNPVLQRLMAKEPADRFANGEEVVTALSDAVPDLMGKNC